MTCSYSSAVAVRTVASTLPSLGEMLSSGLPEPIHSPQKAPGFMLLKPSFLSWADESILEFFILSFMFLVIRGEAKKESICQHSHSSGEFQRPGPIPRAAAGPCCPNTAAVRHLASRSIAVLKYALSP